MRQWYCSNGVSECVRGRQTHATMLPCYHGKDQYQLCSDIYVGIKDIKEKRENETEACVRTHLLGSTKYYVGMY